MKKHKTLFIILFIFLGLAIAAAAIFGVFKLIHNADANGVFTLDEEYMDTAYNNSHLSKGNLAYADGKLYYNYYPSTAHLSSFFTYGVYAVSDHGSHRISHKEFLKYFDMSEIPKKLYVFQGKLYETELQEATPDEYGVITYNDDSPPIENTAVSDHAIYRYGSDVLYISEDGVNEEPLFTQAYDIDSHYWGITASYITDQSIVYLSGDGHLKEYDFDKKEYTVDIELAPYDMQVTDPYDGITYTVITPIKCGDKTVIFAERDRDVSLYEVTDGKLELLYTREGTYAELSGESDFSYYNAIGDNVFISSLGKGIDKINVATGEVTNILPDGSKELYVFGDKWIYYSTKDDKLYCVTQDGQTTKKVF